MAKKEEQFNLRVPSELKDYVRLEAEKQERSMNYIAVKLMEEGKKLQEGKA
ncbi:MAG: Arc domain-containing protein [Blastopirellula sp.]|nr:MAG: Arc domain-containing protein [Blastopirellula sp.]